MEIKTNLFDECEIKFAPGKSGKFEGYASKFGNVDAYGDTIIKGAYAKDVKASKTPPMFISHDSYAIPVGRYTQMKEDDEGLFVVGEIDMGHKDGPTLRSSMEKGNMTGLSIGFRIRKGGSEENEKGGRDIWDIDLKEISVVNFPADDHARILAVKSEIEKFDSIREVEKCLRDSGFSKSSALALVSRIKAIAMGDPGMTDEEITAQIMRKADENAKRLINALDQFKVK